MYLRSHVAGSLSFPSLTCSLVQDPGGPASFSPRSRVNTRQRASPKIDKGKAKMSEYEDDHFDDNESTHSLDNEFGSFDVPIGAKKALISANEKLRRSTREKNPVS